MHHGLECRALLQPYADAPPEGCESLPIVRDFLSPVATKDVASMLRTPADLLDASPIHNERPTGWVDWLRSVGVEPQAGARTGEALRRR